MQEYREILNDTSFFKGISETEIDSMISCLDAKTRNYDKNQYILRIGDSTEAVGLLLTGKILIIQEDYWGNRNICAGITPGQIFAETFACIPDAVMNISVVACESSAVMWLNVGRILHTCPTACSYHNRMIQNLLSAIAGKNLYLNEKLTHISKRTTREKLISYLSAEAQRKNSTEFEIPFNRQQLADYLSVERSAMSNELCKLRDEGKLVFSKSKFKLT